MPSSVRVRVSAIHAGGRRWRPGQGGSSRRDVVAATAQSLGGSVASFYFAFGDTDVFTVIHLPDDEAATAVALTVNASGAVTVKTTVLLTPEQVDAAAQRSVDYTPPRA
jgi:uncharacterized protein with GYD domain